MDGLDSCGHVAEGTLGLVGREGVDDTGRTGDGRRRRRPGTGEGPEVSEKDTTVVSGSLYLRSEGRRRRQRTI